MKNLTFFFLISGSLYSYQIDLKQYYYNLKDFQESKIYEYKSIEDPSNTQYWKITSDTIHKELITETYNSDFVQIEYFKEKFDTSGSKMVKFLIIEDAITSIVSKPIEKNVYLWNDPGPYKYSVTYTSKYGEIYFEKTRKYEGVEKIKVLGKIYNAIKLKGDYIFKIIKQNQTYKYHQYSYYVKDLGFVQYKRFFEDQPRVELHLSNIYNE